MRFFCPKIGAKNFLFFLVKTVYKHSINTYNVATLRQYAFGSVNVMGKYKKCPRCELNWIMVEEELCDVCKAQLKIGGVTLLEDDEEESEERICPICHINYLLDDEEVCALCRADRGNKVPKVTDEIEKEEDEEPASWEEEEAEVEDVHEDGSLSLDKFEAEELEKVFDDEEEDGETEVYHDDEPDDFDESLSNDYDEDEDEEEGSNDDEEDEDDEV